MPARDDVERAFAAACWDAIAQSRSRGYDPTAWAAMIETHGAVPAARRLVASGDIQTGFERLIRLGRPDLTVEWAVLDARWDDLFDETYREPARWRLRQAGVRLPDE